MRPFENEDRPLTGRSSPELRPSEVAPPQMPSEQASNNVLFDATKIMKIPPPRKIRAQN